MKRRRQNPETSRQKMLIEYIDRVLRLPVIRINSGAIPIPHKDFGVTGAKARSRLIRMAPAGTADIYATMKPEGIACWFEVKEPKKKATALQRDFLLRQIDAGACAGVVTTTEEIDYLIAARLRPWGASGSGVKHFLRDLVISRSVKDRQ